MTKSTSILKDTPEQIRGLIQEIQDLAAALNYQEINLMEVCGTHTMSVYRHGLKQVLPPSIHLLAGPGCPVCVTPTSVVDVAIELALRPDVILTTFGDMIKVPGKSSTLIKEKANGADVRVVYSPMDAFELARLNPEKQVVFIAVGFETTAPTIAATVLKAEKEKINNFSIICSNKVMPPPMRALVESGEIKIDGFLCPGHVSTITGAKIFDFLAKEKQIPCVIAGFEPGDILDSVAMLLRQIKEHRAEVEVQYNRCVSWEGNQKAQSILNQVFEPGDTDWRGLGTIPGSGLQLREPYRVFDALKKFHLEMPEAVHIPGCICGDILRGVVTPGDCKLYKKVCTPENPIGPCMVSSEGTCAAYFKYENIQHD